MRLQSLPPSFPSPFLASFWGQWYPSQGVRGKVVRERVGAFELRYPLHWGRGPIHVTLISAAEVQANCAECQACGDVLAMVLSVPCSHSHLPAELSYNRYSFKASLLIGPNMLHQHHQYRCLGDHCVYVGRCQIYKICLWRFSAW